MRKEIAITTPPPNSLALTADDDIETDAAPVVVPDYLERVYWWAYVRPWAIWIFEREWLINLILIGWYSALRDATLAMFGRDVSGRTLQIACAYGSLTPTLSKMVAASGGQLDVVDVVEAQLANLRRKLPAQNSVRCVHADSSDLPLATASYDRVLLFFLMHEQPYDIRLRSLAEAFRVVKPGGHVMIVEFAKPKWWQPLRYLYLPFLKYFEPFAPDIWGHDGVSFWLPQRWADSVVERRSLFGNYYQILKIKA